MFYLPPSNSEVSATRLSYPRSDGGHCSIVVEWSSRWKSNQILTGTDLFYFSNLGHLSIFKVVFEFAIWNEFVDAGAVNVTLAEKEMDRRSSLSIKHVKARKG